MKTPNYYSAKTLTKDFFLRGTEGKYQTTWTNCGCTESPGSFLHPGSSIIFPLGLAGHLAQGWGLSLGHRWIPAFQRPPCVHIPKVTMIWRCLRCLRASAGWPLCELNQGLLPKALFAASVFLPQCPQTAAMDYCQTVRSYLWS